jgi:hypothetical protein
MNFTPPLRPRQLCFAFIEQREPESTPWGRLGMGRSAYYNRRRMQRAVSIAIELERRRRPKAGQKVTQNGSLRPGAPARTPRPFHPNSAAEACELQVLARRVERLCPSHRSPERFHEDKSEIAHALRVIAGRAGYKHARSIGS